MASWALQDAKAKFSEVVESARSKGPQTVTRHGKATVVILAIEEYGRLKDNTNGINLVSFFRKSPLVGLDPNLFSRNVDRGREVKL